MEANKMLVFLCFCMILMIADIVCLVLLEKKKSKKISVFEYPRAFGRVENKKKCGLASRVLITAQTSDGDYQSEIDDFFVCRAVEEGDYLNFRMLVYKDTGTGETLGVMMSEFERS